MGISKLDIECLATAMEGHNNMASYDIDKPAKSYRWRYMDSWERRPLQEQIDLNSSPCLHIETMPSWDSF